MASKRLTSDDPLAHVVEALAQVVDAVIVRLDLLEQAASLHGAVVTRATVELHECVCGRGFERRHGLDVHVSRNGGVGLDHEAVTDRRARMHQQARDAAAASWGGDDGARSPFRGFRFGSESNEP